MKKHLILAAAASALLLSGVVQVKAGPIVFSGFDGGANAGDPTPNSNAAQASFSAAVGSTSLITFESAPLGGFSNLAVAPGVTVSGNGGNASIANSPQGSPSALYGYNTTPGGSQFLSVFGGSVTFTFATPIDAFGAYIGGAQSQVPQETITFNDGSSETVNIPNTLMPNGGMSFVGFSDSGKQIASVQMNFQNDIVSVDDVQYQSVAPSAVPEPASLALLGIATAGLAGYGWRRRKVAMGV